jgi:hypothetical protein
VFEEMILQSKKIFDHKIFDENFWFKPIPDEMILQPLKFSPKTFLMKMFG